MSEPALKCEHNASFKQIYTLKLFIAFKMSYSCCFSLGGNLHSPEFLQKKFYNINNWPYPYLVCANRSNRNRKSFPSFASSAMLLKVPRSRFIVSIVIKSRVTDLKIETDFCQLDAVSWCVSGKRNVIKWNELAYGCKTNQSPIL